MSAKKTKFAPLLINSMDGLRAAINKVVTDKLRAVSLQTEMEQEIAEVQKKYQKRLEPVLRDVATAEAGIQVYAEQHRDDIFPKGVKSLDLQLAVIGFRDTPHRVEKVRSRDTFDEIAKRLASYRELGPPAEEGGEPTVLFNGEDYIRYGEPELDKKSLLSDRMSIPSSAMKAVGLRFDYDELFYLEPKSEVIEGTTEVAA